MTVGLHTGIRTARTANFGCSHQFRMLASMMTRVFSLLCGGVALKRSQLSLITHTQLSPFQHPIRRKPNAIVDLGMVGGWAGLIRCTVKPEPAGAAQGGPTPGPARGAIRLRGWHITFNNLNITFREPQQVVAVVSA